MLARAKIKSTIPDHHHFDFNTTISRTSNDTIGSTTTWASQTKPTTPRNTVNTTSQRQSSATLPQFNDTFTSRRTKKIKHNKIKIKVQLTITTSNNNNNSTKNNNNNNNNLHSRTQDRHAQTNTPTTQTLTIQQQRTIHNRRTSHDREGSNEAAGQQENKKKK